MAIFVMENWHVEGRRFLAFEGENDTRDVYILAPSFEDYTYTLEARNRNRRGIIPLEKADYHSKPALHALLNTGQIGPSGTVQLQVVGRNSEGEQVKKSNIFEARVGESVNASDEFYDMPQSAFEEYLTKVGEYADSAKESAETAQSGLDRLAESVQAAQKAAETAENRAAEADASAKAAEESAKNIDGFATDAELASATATATDDEISEMLSEVFDTVATA